MIKKEVKNVLAGIDSMGFPFMFWRSRAGVLWYSFFVRSENAWSSKRRAPDPHVLNADEIFWEE